MHNTSTQFADGGEFGFGGEVGISTNTLPPTRTCWIRAARFIQIRNY